MALPTLHVATGTLTSGLITTLTISRAARMVSKRPAHVDSLFFLYIILFFISINERLPDKFYTLNVGHLYSYQDSKSIECI